MIDYDEIAEHEADNRYDQLREEGYRNWQEKERAEQFKRASMDYQAMLDRGF